VKRRAEFFAFGQLKLSAQAFSAIIEPTLVHCSDIYRLCDAVGRWQRADLWLVEEHDQ